MQRRLTNPVTGLLARGLLLSYRAFYLVHRGVQVLVEGILLGLLTDPMADQLSEPSYGDGIQYTNDRYLDSGFQFWEKLAVERHFTPGSRILVAAAGGGREMIALSRAGFTVDGFDCSRAMVRSGSKALRERDIPGNLVWASPCAVPVINSSYDGIIVGWNGYTYILPGVRRITFLKSLSMHLEPGSPILLSGAFAGRSPGAVWIARLANAVRICTFRDGNIEIGDTFPGRRRKAFSRGEIEAELAEAELTALESFRWGPFTAVICKKNDPS